MKNFIAKFTSRKYWLAVAAVATGIAIALGADGDAIVTVAGAVTSVISAVTYIITEGKIDAERVAGAIKATQEAVETIKEVQEDESN